MLSILIILLIIYIYRHIRIKSEEKKWEKQNANTQKEEPYKRGWAEIQNERQEALFEQFVRSRWPKNYERYELIGSSLSANFLAPHKIIVYHTDGTYHEEVIKVSVSHNAEKDGEYGTIYKFSVWGEDDCSKTSQKKEKTYEHEVNKIFEGFEDIEVKKNIIVCTNDEYINHLRNKKDTQIAEIVAEYKDSNFSDAMQMLEYDWLESGYDLSGFKEFTTFMDKLTEAFNEYEFDKKSAWKGFEGEKTVEEALNKYGEAWIILKNVVLPILSPVSDAEKNIGAFENDIILLCSNAIYTVEIKNYHSGSISIKPDGRVIHKNKRGDILEGEDQNVVEQAENHRIYLVRFLNEICEKHGLKAKDIVKSIVVIANNDFAVEENAIDFPIYRPVLIGRAIKSNDCDLSDELIKDIKEHIEANTQREHKFKHLLCPEIGAENIDKIRSAMDTIIRDL